MSQNVTEQKALAASLLAHDELTDEEIAQRCDVSRRTLARWKQEPEFQSILSECQEAIKQRILSSSIADKVQRIKRLDKRWRQIDRLIAERAEDPHMMNVPGGQTGLLAHEQKSLGSGDLATVVDVYKADTGLLKEERETAKQAAIELGQWTEKTEAKLIPMKVVEQLAEVLSDERIPADAIDDLAQRMIAKMQEGGTGV